MFVSLVGEAGREAGSVARKATWRVCSWQQAGTRQRARALVVNRVFKQLWGHPDVRSQTLRQLARKDLCANGLVNAATVARALRSAVDFGGGEAASRASANSDTHSLASLASLARL